jgi:phosphoglucosamine mutase
VTKLFGTDGIRGIANKYPMTSEMAVKIGRAIASFFKNTENPKIIIGKDTRISGDMIENALVSGICSMGVDVYLAGIIPTPGIAYLTPEIGANAGIVISASHNPYYDNGIKVFGNKGLKLSDNMESEIEKLILDETIETICQEIQDTGRVSIINNSGNKYSDFLKKCFPENIDLKGLKIVVDCSNGATYDIAPGLLADMGAEVQTLFVNPDGKNINNNCGSQHPEILSKKVIETKSDIGLAYDGDGDRLIVVDEKGDIASGDQILAVYANYLKKINKLKNNIVVSTIMSNMGLGVSLKKLGIKHAMSNVGDRYVLEQMLINDAIIGGEDSGHIIFLDEQTTGDGILAGLKLIEIITHETKPLSELLKIMTVFPQELVNVEVNSKPDINSVPEIVDAIKNAENKLGENGRILVRYSGTQSLCRVMVEGPTIKETKTICNKIADIIKECIG